MILDEISAPLGQNRPAGSPELPVSLSTVMRCALAAVVLIFTAWAMIISEPNAPEPAVSKASPAGTADPELVAKQTAAGEQPRAEAVTVESPAPPPTRTVTIIDGSSGKRQEVLIPTPPEDEGRAEQPKSQSSSRQSRRSESRK